MTRAGEKVGAAYFLAPEARRHSEGIDYVRADVWSLAKCLFVLARPVRREQVHGMRVLDVPPRPAEHVVHLLANLRLGQRLPGHLLGTRDKDVPLHSPHPRCVSDLRSEPRLGLGQLVLGLLHQRPRSLTVGKCPSQLVLGLATCAGFGLQLGNLAVPVHIHLGQPLSLTRQLSQQLLLLGALPSRLRR
jgi:hypothetical protein